MSKEKVRANLSFRVAPTLKKRLSQLAKGDGRKLASYARRVLEKHVEENEDGKV